MGLEDALAIVLALLEREPGSFSRTGAQRGGRLVLERRLELVDAQLVLASLAALERPTAAAGAEALTELARRSGLHRVQRPVGGLAGGPAGRPVAGVDAVAVLRAGRDPVALELGPTSDSRNASCASRPIWSAPSPTRCRVKDSTHSPPPSPERSRSTISSTAITRWLDATDQQPLVAHIRDVRQSVTDLTADITVR